MDWKLKQEYNDILATYAPVFAYELDLLLGKAFEHINTDAELPDESEQWLTIQN